jgi:hypothetical protein
MTVGGYVVFLVIVLIFHVWLAAESEAFASAVWGGAFLSGILVVVALASSLTERLKGTETCNQTSGHPSR